MIYTLDKGLNKRYLPQAIKTTGISLPLLSLLFLAVAIFSFTDYHANGQNPNIKKPALSAATSSNNSANGPKNIKKLGINSGSNGSSGSASGGGASNLSAGSSLSPVSALPSSSPSTSSLPVVGGMGGGGGGSVVTPPSTGGSGGDTITPPPAPTVACSDTLTIAQVCTACVPALTLQPGQKALLSSDGTCVAVN